MDARGFDRWTVTVAHHPSRRAALRLLAGGVLGSLLARGGGVPARAQPRPDRDGDGLYDDDEVEVYGTNPDVFDTDGDGVGDGEEVYLGTDPLTPAGGHCQGLASCLGICTDILTHPDHCGACFNACPRGDICVGGGCVMTEPSSTQICAVQGLTDCGGDCIDTYNDAGNCGACGNACGGGGYCAGGACQGGCLPLGSQCVYGVNECCGGACLSGVCRCSPSRDVCANGSTCCSGVCGGDGFCV